MVQDKHKHFHFVNLPWFGQPPKPLLIEKCQYNLGLGGHMTRALGSSGTMSMAMSSLFVCLFVCLSVCLPVSPFPQPCFNTETVTLVSYPGMANHRSLLNLDLIRPW